MKNVFIDEAKLTSHLISKQLLINFTSKLNPLYVQTVGSEM